MRGDGRNRCEFLDVTKTYGSSLNHMWTKTQSASLCVCETAVVFLSSGKRKCGYDDAAMFGCAYIV